MTQVYSVYNTLYRHGAEELLKSAMWSVGASVGWGTEISTPVTKSSLFVRRSGIFWEGV
jgi:hypothetical protein